MEIKLVLNLFCFHFAVLIFVGADENGCIFPSHPESGQWSILGQNSSPNPGDSVVPGTILELKCNETYILDGESISVCIRGKWTSENAKCLKTCPSLHNTPTMTVTCFDNERKLNSCVNAIEGTRAEFQCASFYKDQGLETNPFGYCYNGAWRGPSPQCVPECGKKNNRRNPTLIVGGYPTEIGEFPWQVALYDVNKTLFCGGTLINQRVILTAAHCITNIDGKLNSKDSYIAAVGKYFRKFNDSRDVNTTQYSAVHKLYIPSNYKADIQNYVGDIGIIVTTRPFFLSETVRPVCLDWTSRAQKSLLDPTSRRKYASVSGWGFTVEHKNQSDILKILNVPVINNEDCEERLPTEYKRFLTSDKLCAGFLNSSSSTCQGDSGGGLVAEYRNRYYIIGVVSVAPLSETPVGGCDSQQYSLYTKVSDYIYSFISNIEAKYKPSFEDNCSLNPSCNIATSRHKQISSVPETTQDVCIAPEDPEFMLYSGNYFIPVRPSSTFAAGRVLKVVVCEPGHVWLQTKTVRCQNGNWYPPLLPCLSKQVRDNILTFNFTKTFSGCIRIMNMNNKTLEPTNIIGVVPCFDKIEPGTFFLESGGFVRLKEPRYKVGVVFNVKLDIKPRRESGVLIAVNGPKDFFVLEMIDGQMSLTIENGNGSIKAVYNTHKKFHFCDGHWHSIQAVKSKNVIALAVDDVFVEPILGYHSSISTDTTSALFLGGHKYLNTSRAKGIVTKLPYVGCIKNVVINDEPIEINAVS